MSSFNLPKKFSRKGTFADLLVRLIVDRRNGDAPAVYTAARIDRRTYSSIVSNPFVQSLSELLCSLHWRSS